MLLLVPVGGWSRHRQGIGDGWWIVDGGWWVVDSGWWMVGDGWWLVVVGWWLVGLITLSL